MFKDLHYFSAFTIPFFFFALFTDIILPNEESIVAFSFLLFFVFTFNKLSSLFYSEFHSNQLTIFTSLKNSHKIFFDSTLLLSLRLRNSLSSFKSFSSLLFFSHLKRLFLFKLIIFSLLNSSLSFFSSILSSLKLHQDQSFNSILFIVSTLLYDNLLTQHSSKSSFPLLG